MEDRSLSLTALTLVTAQVQPHTMLPCPSGLPPHAFVRYAVSGTFLQHRPLGLLHWTGGRASLRGVTSSLVFAICARVCRRARFLYSLPGPSTYYEVETIFVQTIALHPSRELLRASSHSTLNGRAFVALPGTAKLLHHLPSYGKPSPPRLADHVHTWHHSTQPCLNQPYDISPLSLDELANARRCNDSIVLMHRVPP